MGMERRRDLTRAFLATALAVTAWAGYEFVNKRSKVEPVQNTPPLIQTVPGIETYSNNKCGGIIDACDPNPCAPTLKCVPLGNDALGCPISTCLRKP